MPKVQATLVLSNIVDKASVRASYIHSHRFEVNRIGCLDADWSVCAGNWMWVSSSAFERLLDSSLVTCPVALAKRLDPRGEYIKQYVPELANVPKEFIHEPWRMPQSLQEDCETVIGVHYPERMIDLVVAAKQNMNAMKTLRNALIEDGAPDNGPPHCRPSNEDEIRQFFWLAE